MPELSKTTVNLIPRAKRALAAATERLQETNTDAINRAIQVYDLVTRLTEQEGCTLAVRYPDGREQEVLIL